MKIIISPPLQEIKKKEKYQNFYLMRKYSKNMQKLEIVY